MKLLRNLRWTSVLRWSRAALAVAFIASGLVEKQPVALVLGGFLGLQALFNVGCCGAVCTPGRSARTSASDEVFYEEVKQL